MNYTHNYNGRLCIVPVDPKILSSDDIYRFCIDGPLLPFPNLRRNGRTCPWFDSGEIATVNERNKVFSIQTTEDELVSKYCTSGDGWLSATEVAEKIEIAASYRLTKSSARDFGYALKKAGFQSRKLDGITRYAVAVSSSLKYDPTSSGVRSGVRSGETSAESVESTLF